MRVMMEEKTRGRIVVGQRRKGFGFYSRAFPSSAPCPLGPSKVLKWCWPRSNSPSAACRWSVCRFFLGTSSLSLSLVSLCSMDTIGIGIFPFLAAASATRHKTLVLALSWHGSPALATGRVVHGRSAHRQRCLLSSPSSLAWRGAGWFCVDEQATGGSRGGHSGLSNSVTRANRRQQQGIGCTSTCQRINADIHSTTRPLDHSTHHPSVLREIDTLRQDDPGAVRSEPPAARSRLSRDGRRPPLTTMTRLLLLEIKGGKTTGRPREHASSKLNRSWGRGCRGGRGEGGEGSQPCAVLLFLLLRGPSGSAKKNLGR
ncbi:hypothetical protein B0T18DRAFT_249277 [Schizothecium vesticola]|uniref:Uncharacterized protein n=1 Tax=Schizothecium vesticola TaxID=314040 RepID=A0AA40EIK1_9PEZI|nr:hypothetical protein B0T18DRAFT_249277 [Schizothecium vesticola]